MPLPPSTEPSPVSARQLLAGNPEDRIYGNAGNAALLALIDADARAVLDVGCGAGDNAALLMARQPQMEVYGITGSEPEAVLARGRMTDCWVTDLENGFPPEARGRRYDVVLFSHVLEHLRDPAELVGHSVALLRPGGACVIAVPNVLVWTQRAKFLRGRFEYESSGIMDETHLRFFTYETAAKYLLAKAPELRVAAQRVSGSVPLWVLRRHLLPAGLSSRIDAAGCALLPNLFGWQVLLKAILPR
jgi:2-polyprenyl-3-methyl-5-hydroxy-6-metoxy-1,4-benzoquinol methylase